MANSGPYSTQSGGGEGTPAPRGAVLPSVFPKPVFQFLREFSSRISPRLQIKTDSGETSELFPGERVRQFPGDAKPRAPVLSLNPRFRRLLPAAAPFSSHPHSAPAGAPVRATPGSAGFRRRLPPLRRRTHVPSRGRLSGRRAAVGRDRESVGTRRSDNLQLRAPRRLVHRPGKRQAPRPGGTAPRPGPGSAGRPGGARPAAPSPGASSPVRAKWLAAPRSGQARVKAPSHLATLASRKRQRRRSSFRMKRGSPFLRLGRRRAF